MATERDDNERKADYYASLIPGAINDVLEVTQEIIRATEAGTAMTYAQFLTLERKFKDVENYMRVRDVFGMHSATGQARFRHIAHPEKYPNPEKELA